MGSSPTPTTASTTSAPRGRAPSAAKAGGETRAAAGLAIALIDLHTSVLGNAAAGNGWRARAERLLDEAGHCVEQGHYEIAVIACDRPDVDALAASADRARAIGEEFGDAGLVVRALAEGGLALVSQGRTAEGFARLDEALASICAGRSATISPPSAGRSARC